MISLTTPSNLKLDSPMLTFKDRVISFEKDLNIRMFFEIHTYKREGNIPNFDLNDLENEAKSL